MISKIAFRFKFSSGEISELENFLWGKKKKKCEIVILIHLDQTLPT